MDLLEQKTHKFSLNLQDSLDYTKLTAQYARHYGRVPEIDTVYHNHAHIGYLLGRIYARITEEESDHYSTGYVHGKLQICESLEGREREREQVHLVSSES